MSSLILICHQPYFLAMGRHVGSWHKWDKIGIFTEKFEYNSADVIATNSADRLRGRKIYNGKTAYKCIVNNFQKISEQELFDRSREKWAINLTTHNDFWAVNSYFGRSVTGDRPLFRRQFSTQTLCT